MGIAVLSCGCLGGSWALNSGGNPEGLPSAPREPSGELREVGSGLMGKTGQDRKMATRGKSLPVTVCTLLENLLLFRTLCVCFHFESIISTVTISLTVLNHRSRHLEMIRSTTSVYTSEEATPLIHSMVFTAHLLRGRH